MESPVYPSLNSQYVWYASYGSNMAKERFMCYIEGGRVEGMKSSCPGCRDHSPPRKDACMTISHELYFARNSYTWGGGPAFVDMTTRSKSPPTATAVSPSKLAEKMNNNNNNTCTIMRVYLVKRDQFLDVVNQENRLSDNVNCIDFDEVIKKRQHMVCNGWYGLICYLGDYQGYPVFTFTSTDPSSKADINAPSPHYLQIMSTGMKQMGLTDNDIVLYFQSKKGVHQRISFQKLQTAVSSAPVTIEKYAGGDVDA